MMLGEESESADYWKKCGDEALAYGIKGVIIMVCSPFDSETTYLCRNRVPTGAAQEATAWKLR
jgi:hypothetical protein